MWPVLGALVGGVLCYLGGRAASRWLEEPRDRLRPWHVWATAGVGALWGGLLAHRLHFPSGAFLQAMALAAILITASLVDLFDRIIPNELMALGALLWPLFHLVSPAGPAVAIGAPDNRWLGALLGLLAGGGLLILLVLIHPGGMGMGDVKMAGMYGLYLGWPGAVVALFIAFVLGGLVSLILLLARVVTRKQHIPFGPFLTAGALATLVWGQELMAWYWLRP